LLSKDGSFLIRKQEVSSKSHFAVHLAHPDNTKIGYCKKNGRNLEGIPCSVYFLGFSFQPIRNKL